MNKILEEVIDLYDYTKRAVRICFRDILNATVYRVKYGFNPNETWNLDYTLAEYLVPRLMYLKKSKQGIPYNVTYDIEKKFKKIKDKDKLFQLAEAEWNDRLDAMIAAFNIIKNNGSDLTSDDQDAINKGLDLFRKHFQDLWS